MRFWEKMRNVNIILIFYQNRKLAASANNILLCMLMLRVSHTDRRFMERKSQTELKQLHNELIWPTAGNQLASKKIANIILIQVLKCDDLLLFFCFLTLFWKIY